MRKILVVEDDLDLIILYKKYYSGQVNVEFDYCTSYLKGMATIINEKHDLYIIDYKLGEESGRNEYGGVYGELYRKFSITSYKLLPANRFQEAMKFLTNWHQSLVGEEPF